MNWLSDTLRRSQSASGTRSTGARGRQTLMIAQRFLDVKRHVTSMFLRSVPPPLFSISVPSHAGVLVGLGINVSPPDLALEVLADELRLLDDLGEHVVQEEGPKPRSWSL